MIELETFSIKKTLLLLFVLPFTFFGQVTFNKIPLDKQLVARDISSNKGVVIIEGQVDNTATPYESIQVNVFRNGITYGSPHNQSLNFPSNLASFNFNINIDAELANYSFEIFGLKGGTSTLIKKVNDIVSGDVYIIEGQSNAVASIRDVNDSARDNESEFIRVFASGTVNIDKLIENETWNYGKGDVEQGTLGNVGQWGIKLARLILDSEQIPVAIFNGATGNRPISHFQRPVDYQSSLDSNYGRLFYRLEKTGLKDNVRAVFWSQGEATMGITTNEYKNEFMNLMSSWKSDYSNLKKFYIFQTKTHGLGSPIEEQMETREAQRQLAVENANVHIMATEALTSFNDAAFAHFVFTNGYETFADRIYRLVKRDFYSGNNGIDIESPMITDAYLTDGITLVIETSASSLSMDASTIDGFQLNNANGVSINSIGVNNNKIIFMLSGHPGLSASISYIGLDIGIVNGDFIRNSNNIELVCFNKFPIADRITSPMASTWDGTSWLPYAPNSSRDAIIEGNYDASDGNITAKSLMIKPGVELNFNKGTTNSVIVYGDLTIDGAFIIGDKESLLMLDDNAVIKGDITKNESSFPRAHTNDLTYWSSPISNADIATVFNGVRPSRIFYYDQSKSSASDPDNDPDGTYWDVWVVASGKMIPGVGIAAEGPMGETGVHKITFTGPPNNGKISVPLKGNFGDSDPQNDFNLVGNPYPSAMDIDLFLKGNSSVIDPTIYLWSHSTSSSGEDFTSSNYVAYNNLGGTTHSSGGVAIPHKNLGSAQGFFVRALNTGSIVFNNSMRERDEKSPFYPDKDGDGYTSNVDCDDNNAAVNPGVEEILYNGMDDDCNPTTPDMVDADGDGYAGNVDCDDTNPAINHGATDIPNNGIDEDCDGKDATEEEETCTSEISANLNLNPGKSENNTFRMETPSGIVDMNTLSDKGSDYTYKGDATSIKIRVKAKGSTLIVNGKEISLDKERNYEFSGTLSVSLKNTKKDKKGKSNGHWWISIEGKDVCFDRKDENCENIISANLNLYPKKSKKDMFTMVTPEGIIDMKDLLKEKGNYTFTGNASSVKIKVKTKGSSLIVNGKEIKIDKKHLYEFTGELSVSLTNSKKNKKGKKSKDYWWISIKGNDICIDLDKKTKNNDDDDDKDDKDKSNDTKYVSGKTDIVKAKSSSEQEDLIWLDLRTDRGGFNQILIGFTEKATNGIDKGYDALKMMVGNNPIDFYSIIENNKYIIQGLNRFSEDKTVSLGYKSNVYPRTLTISLNRVEGDLKDSEIYLEDNYLGITHELSKSDYEFSQKEAGEYSDRFTIKFVNGGLATLQTENIENNNTISLVRISNGYSVNSNRTISKVKVYDTLGRILHEVEPNRKEFLLTIDSVRYGSTILLLEMILDNGSRVVKKAISY